MNRWRVDTSAIEGSMRASPRAAIAGIVALALLVGGAHAAVAAPEQDSAVVGDAATIEAGVEVRIGAESPYEALADIKPVAVGDGVRTDTTGYAEITYFDGSKTRLDIDTEFEVVELVNDAGVASTRTSMGVGRTWNRVEQLGEGEFTVETSQATATVRGTAFVLDCDTVTSCTFLVVEGVVELTLADGSVVVVVGPAQVEVVDGIAGPVTPVSLEQVLADPWLADNIVRDVAAGFFDLRDVAVTTTTAVATEPGATTTEPGATTTEPGATTTEPGATTTEPGATISTTTLPEDTTTTTTTLPDDTTTTTTTTEPEPEATTSTTTLPEDTTTTSTTQPRETPTSSTTLPPTTTSSTTTTAVAQVGQIPLCHWTGAQYLPLLVDLNGALTHLVQHAPFDIIPLFTGRCPASAEAAALVAPTSLPPSTAATTTTAPLETVTTAATTTTSSPATTAAVPVSTAVSASEAVRAETAEAPPPSSSAPATTATEAAAAPTTSEAAAGPTTTAPDALDQDAELTSTRTEPAATTETTPPPAAERPTGWGRRPWPGGFGD
jgi:hypothetical protein